MAGYLANNPTTAAISQIMGGNIYINPSLINGMSPWDQMALLLHEFIHNITGAVDSTIQGELGLPSVDANGKPVPSQNIADKLRNDCL